MSTAIKPSVRAIQSDSTALHVTTRAVVALVALGAAILSFDALTALALSSGIRSEFAWIWAVVIDGFIMVATFAAFALRDRGTSKYYAYSTLGLFVAFSIMGNAWHAAIAKDSFELPIQIAVIVTAIPPLALFLAIHLLIIMVSPTPEQKVEHKRELERKERLRKIQEKELEKIEREAAIREIREQNAASRQEVLELGQQARKASPIASPPTRQEVPPAPSTPVKKITQSSNETLQPAPAALSYQSGSDSGIPPVVTPVVAEQPATYIDSSPTIAPQVESETLNENQVRQKLLALVEAGQPLPTGKVVAGWLGKSERTGQNLLKAFRAEISNPA